MKLKLPRLESPSDPAGESPNTESQTSALNIGAACRDITGFHLGDFLRVVLYAWFKEMNKQVQRMNGWTEIMLGS